MDENHLLIQGCPLCALFLNPEENIKSKLYYPTLDEVTKIDFIVLECSKCGTPMIVLRDHVTYTTNAIWGKISLECKKIFNNPLRIKYYPCQVEDHWHAHILKSKRY